MNAVRRLTLPLVLFATLSATTLVAAPPASAEPCEPVEGVNTCVAIGDPLDPAYEAYCTVYYWFNKDGGKRPPTFCGG